MQNSQTTETRTVLVFDKKLEDIPGGVTLAIADLAQASVAPGTPVGKDSNGLYHVVKTAKAQANATNSATAIKVLKGHNFKVGDFLTTATGKIAYAISAITTTNADYDTLTVGTTLGVAITAGDILIQAAAEATGDTSTQKYTAIGLTGTYLDVVSGDNHLVDVIVRGTVREAAIVPIHSVIKTSLSHIRFV